ncbi:MAG TPA: sialidase family protein [Thermoanaerobaculia bacterium]|nr:sialidase family protein [Thermoanaerobaculia bacterium]
MRKPSSLPTLVLWTLCAAGALPLAAAVTGSGTLSPGSPELAYSSGPFLISNPTIQPIALTGGDQPLCEDPVLPCDDYLLDVDIPAGYKALNPDHRIVIQIDWDATANDFDMFLLDDAGAVVDDSATGGNPEIIVLPVTDGLRHLRVRVEPFLVTNSTYNGTITLGPAPFTPFIPGSEPPPVFRNFAAPNNWGENFGEPSIGVNPTSGNVMFTGRRYLNVAGKTLRVAFDDATDPAGSTWTDVTPVSSMGTSADPIGYTDRTTGRTFVSQLHAACSLTEYTDNDGDLWLPSEGCGLPTLFDHQTLGGGPFAAPETGLGIYPNAVYYCAQTVVEAGCAISLDGGITFGAGIPVYTTECSGLHGHIKVAPDGTAYLPNKGCAPNHAVIVSENNGQDWQIRRIPNSTPGSTDPSVGIATDGTVYFGYVNGDGHPRIAVSHDRGITWENDADVGTPFGLKNAVFPAVAAGDPDRAAFAFHGTTAEGNFGAVDFPGTWYLYVAVTYDGGESWITVNATPDDPVQGPGGICSIGFSCDNEPDNRNLLDFFDATIDNEGRILVGYADGCLGCDLDSVPEEADFLSYGTIARQSGGLRMLSEFDPAPPLEDVTERTKLVQTGAVWKSGVSSFKLKIKNVSTAPIAAPIHALVASISSSDVTVANADNGDTGVGATFDFSALLNGDDQLAPDEMSQARELRFNAPSKAKYSVTFRVLRGDPTSDSVAAEDAGSATQPRMIRADVDPLLGLVTITILPR